MASVTLSSTILSNLLSLQNTSALINQTSGRLTTGLAIASPIDDAIKYFAAKTLTDRAGDLTVRKDAIAQGVNTLQTMVNTTTSIESITQQLKGVIDASRSGTKQQRAEYGKQISQLVTQVQRLVDDSTYQGLNLLNATAASLTVRFSDKAASKLLVNGVDFNVSNYFLNSQGTAALGVTAGTGTVSATLTKLGFSGLLSVFSLSVAAELASFNTWANAAVGRMEKTVDNLRSKAATLAGNVAILQVRLDFTSNYVNTLNDGSNKLKLADLNAEGANLLSLQTRQQLGLESLKFAGQSEQSILTLFR